MAKGSKGKLVQVIGTVVDVEFPAEELPAVYSAVEIDAGDGQKLKIGRASCRERVYVLV